MTVPLHLSAFFLTGGPSDLQGALAPLLEVSEHALAVVEDDAGIGTAPVVVVQQAWPLDFPVELGIYLRAATEGMPLPGILAQRMAQAWRVGVLWSDDDPNPYQWLHVAPEQAVHRVFLDVQAFDAGRMVIARRA